MSEGIWGEVTSVPRCRRVLDVLVQGNVVLKRRLNATCGVITDGDNGALVGEMM